MQDIFTVGPSRATDYLTATGREKIAYRQAAADLVSVLTENQSALEALNYVSKQDRDGVGPITHQVKVVQDDAGMIEITASQNDMVYISGDRTGRDGYFIVRANSYQLQITGERIQAVSSVEAFGHDNGRNMNDGHFMGISDMPNLQPELSLVKNLKDATVAIYQVVGFLVR